MSRLRQLILTNATLVLALLVIALAVKAVLPAGTMLSAGGERFLTVTICADASGVPRQMQIAIPEKSEAAGDHGDGAGQSQPCAFGGLAKPMLGGADAVLLATALAFILLVGLAPLASLSVRKTPFLRPQLRGPSLQTV